MKQCIFACLMFVWAQASIAQGEKYQAYLDSGEKPCDKKEAKYFIDSQIDSTGSLQGEAKLYYVQEGITSQQLYYKGVYKNGYKHGSFTYYYTDGNKKASGTYNQDKKVGMWQNLYEKNKGMYQTLHTKEETKIVNFWDSTKVMRMRDGTGTFYNFAEVLSVKFFEAGEYKDYKRVNIWQGTYDSGKPYYKETWDNGTLKEGVSYDDQGEQYTYTDVRKNAEYGTGQESIAKHLSENFVYPKNAQRLGIQGRVLVHFVVDAEGNAKEHNVLKPVHPELDAEALRLVKSLRKWKPARLRGQAVLIFFSLPILFELK